MTFSRISSLFKKNSQPASIPQIDQSKKAGLLCCLDKITDIQHASAAVKHVADYCRDNMISPSLDHPEHLRLISTDADVVDKLHFIGFDSLQHLIDKREASDDELLKILANFPHLSKLKVNDKKPCGDFLEKSYAGGTRGDHSVYNGIRLRVANKPLPATQQEYRTLLENAYLDVTGKPSNTQDIHIRGISQTGLSGGYITENSWSRKLDRLSERPFRK